MVSGKEPNSLAASKKLMQNYLSELLTEDAPQIEETAKVETPAKDKLNKLLQQASVASEVKQEQLDVITSVKSENKLTPVTTKTDQVDATPVESKLIEPVAEVELTTKKSQATFEVKVDKDYRKGRFQAMFFDVAGLTIAVPLIELGGIHNVEKTTSLVGKPDWFKGVMVHREDKINVVDTARWVMPEKCTEQLCNSLNYQYIIMLNNSQWGLMAENLIDTVTLEQDDVKWMPGSSKRPWLAGLVKERMCALLDVDALITLLNDGSNVNDK